MEPLRQNWNADDYAKNSGQQFKWAQELIGKLALQGDESVLDIGCGDGKITAQLSRMANRGRVLGIDLSEDMICLAKERFPSSTHPNLSFVRMDASQICLSERFDVAFSNAALHWVPDHLAVLRGARSCLKPDGRILFQMGGRGNAAEVLAALETLMQLPRWKEFFGNYTPQKYYYAPEDYAAWLPAAGFQPVRVELIPKDMQHRGLDGLKSWFRTTWFPYTDCVPEHLRDRFLNELVDTFAASHPMDDAGKMHVKMVRLEVDARAV